MKALTIEKDAVGQRLDRFLGSISKVSRTSIQLAIKSGQLKVNQCLVKPSYVLLLGDIIEGELPKCLQDEKNTTIEAEEGPLPIVYEDKDVLVINKPVGLVCHPGTRVTEATLVNRLLSHNAAIAKVGESNRPGIVHRLDKDTEGLMVIAKTQKAYKGLVDQFKERLIEKKYYAVVKGNVNDDEFIINMKVGRHRRQRMRRAARQADPSTMKEAITECRVLKRFTTKTLLECRPKTGRTHQIRVHLSEIGHPVLGDALYGPPSRRQETGQLLQAYSLGFTHPCSGQRLDFELKLSERLK